MSENAWIIIGKGPVPEPVPMTGNLMDGHIVIWPPEVLIAKVGDPIFIAGGRFRCGHIEYWVNTGKFKLSDAGKVNDTVFFDRADAEARVEEWKAAKYDPTYDRF